MPLPTTKAIVTGLIALIGGGFATPAHADVRRMANCLAATGARVTYWQRADYGLPQIEATYLGPRQTYLFSLAGYSANAGKVLGYVHEDYGRHRDGILGSSVVFWTVGSPMGDTRRRRDFLRACAHFA